MKVELVTKTVGDGPYEDLSPGEIIEAVARHGQKKSYGKLIKFLTRNGHWSPLEHVHYGFKIETSRAISAQFARHKSLHFQEFSQRFSEVPSFQPVELRMEHPTNRQSSIESLNPKSPKGKYVYEVVEEALMRTENFYKMLIEAGVAKECARMILPMCSSTTIHMTGNLRDWLAFLNQRCEGGTQKEAREIALAIGEIIFADFPDLEPEMDWRNGHFM